MAIEINKDTYYTFDDVTSFFGLAEAELRMAGNDPNTGLRILYIGGTALIRGDYLLNYLDYYMQAHAPGTNQAAASGGGAKSLPPLAATGGLMRTGQFEDPMSDPPASPPGQEQAPSPGKIPLPSSSPSSGGSKPPPPVTGSSQLVMDSSSPGLDPGSPGLSTSTTGGQPAFPAAGSGSGSQPGVGGMTPGLQPDFGGGGTPSSQGMAAMGETADGSNTADGSLPNGAPIVPKETKLTHQSYNIDELVDQAEKMEKQIESSDSSINDEINDAQAAADKKASTQSKLRNEWN